MCARRESEGGTLRAGVIRGPWRDVHPSSPAGSGVSAPEDPAAGRADRGWQLGAPPALEAYVGHLGDEPVVLLEWPTAGEAARKGLSRSEANVLDLVLAGLSSAEIAARRARSRRTVENQLAAIYAKLGVRGRLELFARLSAGGAARA